MGSKLPLKPVTMKNAGASTIFEIFRATASVAGDVAEKTMPRWLRVTSAVVSVATVASLGVAYALLKSKPTVSTRRPSQVRPTPELEATWRAIFEQLGELASYSKVPLGIVRRFATNTYRGTLHLSKIPFRISFSRKGAESMAQESQKEKSLFWENENGPILSRAKANGVESDGKAYILTWRWCFARYMSSKFAK